MARVTSSTLGVWLVALAAHVCDACVRLRAPAFVTVSLRYSGLLFSVFSPSVAGPGVVVGV